MGCWREGNMPKRAIIFGTGSFADLADLYLRTDASWEVVAFVVTGDRVDKGNYRGRPVFDIEEIVERVPPDSAQAFVAVGYRKLNSLRAEFCATLKGKGYKLLSYVSSKASYWQETPIGENVFIFEDNTVQPFGKIGDGAVLWSGNHIGHHSTIGDFCFLTSHVVVSGHCTIGERSFLGVNCTIADSLTIGPRNLIGPGALIQKSTGPDEAYFAARAEKFGKPSSWFMK
jgi:sugar O-acyltransferase (sialic acid O-acetyltransferase NeuD family)